MVGNLLGKFCWNQSMLLSIDSFRKTVWCWSKYCRLLVVLSFVSGEDVCLHMLLMQARCVFCNLMSMIYTSNKDLEDDDETCDLVTIYWMHILASNNTNAEASSLLSLLLCYLLGPGGYPSRHCRTRGRSDLLVSAHPLICLKASQ